MIKVYRYKWYDGSKDEWFFQPRWATKEAIESNNCVVIEEISAEIDEKYLNGNGMTAIGFDPNLADGG